MIAENLSIVLKNISNAAKSVGKSAADVTLIVVSKNFGVEAIAEAYKAGIRDFGENRVQEAKGKIGQLSMDIRWHLIGHLQGNKAKEAVELFNIIHSVDSVKLAQTLDSHCSTLGKRLNTLLQVNIGNEGTKSGIQPADALSTVKDIIKLKNIKLTGLMAIPPYSENKEDSRQYFKSLRTLKENINNTLGENILTELSMGMSNDYEVAIQEGATYVRVGTAIFGERTKN